MIYDIVYDIIQKSGKKAVIWTNIILLYDNIYTIIPKIMISYMIS
jgi:hypothetical protein